MKERLSRFKSRRFTAAVLLLLGLFVFLVSRGGEDLAERTPTISFASAEHVIEEGRVQLLTVHPAAQAVHLRLDSGVTLKTGIPLEQDHEDLLTLARAEGVPVEVVSSLGSSSSKSSGGALALDLLFLAIPILILVFLGAFLYLQLRGNRSVKIKPVTSTVTFADVAGCGEVVEELEDIRDFLRDPKKYAALGARVPKGVMLYGPPGTGKTLVAKAVANEAGIPFFAVSGSDFVEKYVGVGASRVRSLFKQAKKVAPAIVFIDEVDAVGRTRDAGGHGGAREGDQTLNQLLVEMDGFEVSDNPVIVMAASNRLDTLDSALLRPGRFDRHVAVDPPDRKGRLEVLSVHAKGKAFAADVDLEALAGKTAGMSGAELANVLNEAALHAARRGAAEITQADLEDGFVRVIAGAKKQNRALSEREKRAVAYHEAAHALAAELLDSPQKVEQISIMPRGQAAGFMIYSNEEDVLLESRSQLMGRLVTLLAGRAAEELVVGDVTTGAGDDLKRATAIVQAMVTKLGMGDALGLYVSDGETPKEARAEIQAILKERYQAAKDLLEDNWDLLEQVAQVLLVEETIDRARFLEIVEAAKTKAENTPLPLAVA